MTDSNAMRKSLIDAMCKADEQAIADTGGVEWNFQPIDWDTASEAERDEYLTRLKACTAQLRMRQAYRRRAMEDWMKAVLGEALRQRPIAALHNTKDD